MTSTRISTAGAGLLAAVVLGTAACSAGAAHPAPASSGHAASETSHPGAQTASDARNQRLAQLAVTRSFSLMRLPAGSTRLPGRPHGVPVNGGFSLWQDGRVAWFSVPLNRSATWTYLRAHPPTGMHWGGGYGQGPDTISMDLYQNRMPDRVAFSGPSFLVIWGDVGDHTLVEMHADVQARHVRPSDSLVGAGVTAVHVTRTRDVGAGSASAPVDLTFTDPVTIAQLRAAVNRMYGNFIDPQVYPCPMSPSPPLVYAITFSGGAHVLAFRWQPGCAYQVTVVRDGRPLPVTLDPGNLDAAVDSVIAHRTHSVPATP
ncbi:MAG: hypothetical protein JWR52_3255 [Marmoricola sp.]|nr:hypothetical protein [Marmoricola sp.]